MKKRPLFSILLIVLLSSLLFNNCGYRLVGYGKQIPDHIKTIFIPDFDNKTTSVEAERFVTASVKEEFITRSRLRLVNNREDADAILEGRIESFRVVPISYADDATANLYQLNITVSARFIDLQNNKMIFEGENIKFTDAYEIDEQQADDFFTWQTELLEKIAERFAESVVVTILENF